MALLIVVTMVAGAGSATLDTAVSNFNTAITTSMANAQGTANVNPASIQVLNPQMIFDGTLYVGSATLTYRTG